MTLSIICSVLYFTAHQDYYSDNLLIGDDFEEPHSSSVPVITFCEESKMPVTLCVEVSSTGEGSETVSLQFHSSQASIPEEETSTWRNGGAKQQTAEIKRSCPQHLRWSLLPCNVHLEHDVGRRLRHPEAILHTQS